MLEKSMLVIAFAVAVILSAYGLLNNVREPILIGAVLISLTLAYNFVIELKTSQRSVNTIDTNSILSILQDRVSVLEKEMNRINSLGVY